MLYFMRLEWLKLRKADYELILLTEMLERGPIECMGE